MATEQRVLILHLKGEYFDAIRDGTKLVEYRLRNDHWKKVLASWYDVIELHRGYPKRGDSSRIIRRVYRGYKYDRILHPHFGPDPVDVFAINVVTPAP